MPRHEIGSVVGAAIDLFGIATDVSIPGSNTASAIIDTLLRKRLEIARDIFLEEIKAGNAVKIKAATRDHEIGVMYRFSRAAQEGAARENLKLLAKFIVGFGERGKLFADDFYNFSAAISTLTRDELILIAALYRNRDVTGKIFLDERDTINNAWLASVEELVPGIFTDKEEMQEIAGSAQRSGLVIAKSVWGGETYLPTKRLYELSKTIDFDDAIRGVKRATEPSRDD
jgi:hypothetical protein